MLAALGLYGVMAYFVSQRTAEIGIRIALGAQKRDVLNRVLGEGMKLAGLGVFFGVIGASATTRALSALLLGVTAIDPLTFVLVTMALLGIAASACLVPAVRAARLDPMLAMRQE